MTGTAAPALTEEVTLPVRAAGYALEGLAEVTAADLGRPTPCGDWDLRTLLLHLADAADALSGLVATGSWSSRGRGRTAPTLTRSTPWPWPRTGSTACSPS